MGGEGLMPFAAARGVDGSPKELFEEAEEEGEEEEAPLGGAAVVESEVARVTESEGPNETVRLGVDPGRSCDILMEE